MSEPAGRRIPGAAAILLIAVGVAGQRIAFGAVMAAPARLAAGTGEQPMLIAAVAQAVAAGALVQETRSADAPAGPQAGGQETKSVARQPSSKQRRRKPKMAGVPPGSPVAAQEAAPPAVQAATQEIRKAETPAKALTGDASKVADEEPDPFAPSRPVAAQKAEEPDPFAASRPEAPPPAAKPAPETKPAKGGKRYAMAPVRWAARVSETLGLLRERRTESSMYGQTPSSSLTSKRTFSNTQSAEIKASSYIMQPYIAMVGGGIGVLSSKENTNTTVTTNGMSGGDVRSANRDNKLFGNGNLALFARSRFPFTASASSTDSRAGQELGGEDTTLQTLNLQQNYRPVIGPSRYALGYQLHKTEAQRSGNYSYSLLNGTYSTRMGSKEDQPFNSSVRRAVSKSRQGDTLTTDILSAQHTYLPPDSLLSLKSYANFTRSEQGDQTLQSGSRGRFLQLSTVMGWQPEDEDMPLFLTGTARYYRAVTAAQGSEAATTNLSGNLSAFYDASTNLKYNADAGVTRSISRGTADLITTQSASATYRSDAIKLGNKSSYFWTANGGATNQTGGQSTGGGSGFNPRAFAGVGHNLNGPLDFSIFGKAVPRYSLGQDVSANTPLSENAGRIAERTIALRNNAGLSSAIGNDRLSGSASATITDARVYGGVNAGRTRTVSVSIGGQGQQPIYESYGAKVDGSVQTTRAPDGRMQTSGALVGTYAKYNVFGVRNLRYKGQLDITAKSASSTNTASSGTTYKPLSYRLDQHLSYRLGQNEARLTAFLDDKDGVKHASLFLQLRAWRTIGN
ncbi:MAG: hypothetical protein HY846_01690 [Nitrosomonadales bacterium]|nr:hypothetical protein [Nitrosomonadales bacterium]